MVKFNEEEIEETEPSDLQLEYNEEFDENYNSEPIDDGD
jgi:hypothetical protein